MTVSITDTKETFVCDGETTVFSFDFKLTDEAELLVFIVGSDGSETPMTLNTDYEVTLHPDQNSDPGGFIVMETAPGVNVPLVLMRGMSFTRGTEFSASVPAHIIESELDRLTMYAQQLSELADRCLHVGAAFQTDPNTGLGSIPLRASKVVGFDDVGNATLYGFESGSLVGPQGSTLSCRVTFSDPQIFRQASNGDWSHTATTVTFIWTLGNVAVETRQVEITIDDVLGEFIDPALVEPGDDFTSTLTGTQLLNLTSEYEGVREYAYLAIVAMPDDAGFVADVFTPAWGAGEFVSDPVGDVDYTLRGNVVSLTLAAALTAVSDTAAMTWDAGTLPAEIRPALTRVVTCVLQYSDTVQAQGQVQILADGSAIFTMHEEDAALIVVDGAFQIGEDKGLPAEWQIIYQI